MERHYLAMRIGMGLCALVFLATHALSQDKDEYAKSNKELARLLMEVSKAKGVKMEGPISFGDPPIRKLKNCWLYRSSPLDPKKDWRVECYIDAKTGVNHLRIGRLNEDFKFEQVGSFVECGRTVTEADVKKLWGMLPRPRRRSQDR